MANLKISIIGLGFVGSAMFDSFKLKGLIPNINLFGYDKYKNGGIGNFSDCANVDIAFLALPTKFDGKSGQYDKSIIIDVCNQLVKHNFSGIIVLKSTVEPETTNNLSKQFPTLQFIHNPEFLTARTAFEDFHSQSHIVLGKGLTCSELNLNNVVDFYKNLFPTAQISTCSSLESESMKIFCNCFYAVKVQFFTELFLLCQSNNCNYEIVKNMMLKNGWINNMHTTIPGPDGSISYGGLCFPKDTNALLKYMEKQNVPHKVLESSIKERNEMRDDHDNCQ